MSLPAEPAELRRPVRSALLADLHRFLSARIDRLEWGDAQRIGRALGRLAWRLSARDRARALEHIGLAFPELDTAERIRLGRAAFAHLGTMLGETLWLAERGPSEVDRRVEVRGWPQVEAARAGGRPILVLTGHCGNWELLAATLNGRGLRLAVVARELHEPGFQEALLAFRARFGSRTILRGTPGAARELLRTLRSGGALGMLIDQDTRVDGVWVEFFGRPAWTPAGAADIASRFSASVLPAFIERRADGSHLATIGAPLELPADPVAATQAMTAAIDSQIRRVPEQWVWMHRRWRRRPDTGSSGPMRTASAPPP